MRVLPLFQRWISKTDSSTDHPESNQQLFCYRDVQLIKADLLRSLWHGGHWYIHEWTSQAGLVIYLKSSCTLSNAHRWGSHCLHGNTKISFQTILIQLNFVGSELPFPYGCIFWFKLSIIVFKPCKSGHVWMHFSDDAINAIGWERARFHHCEIYISI